MIRLDIKNKNQKVAYRVYFINKAFEGTRTVKSNNSGVEVVTSHISREAVKGLVETNRSLLLMSLQPKWNSQSKKIKTFNEVLNIASIIKDASPGLDNTINSSISKLAKVGHGFDINSFYKDSDGKIQNLDTKSFFTFKDLSEDKDFNLVSLLANNEHIIVERVLLVSDILTSVPTIFNAIGRFFKKLLNKKK